VWKAWTNPEEIKRWWGPKNFTAPFVKIDFRVGGKYLLAMRGPDGKDYWNTGIYKEISPMERIVVTDSFSDEKGNVVPATYYGMGEGFPLEMTAEFTFEDDNGKTKFTLKYLRMGNLRAEDRKNMEQGWTESFDKLAASLQKPEVITVG
jgi:uncharacterized protein YndB with AHSA1/START domain